MFKSIKESLKLINQGYEFTVPILNKTWSSTIINIIAFSLINVIYNLIFEQSLALIWLLVILITLLSIFALKRENVLYSLIGDNNRILKNNERYRIITSGLIHADYWHLVLNMVSIVYIVKALYLYLSIHLGQFSVPVIYSAFFLGTLLGGLLTYHSKFGKNNPLHLGSSSGVFALLTLLVLFLPKNNLYIFGLIPINSLTFLGTFALLSLIAMFKEMPIFDMIISFSKHKVNHAGHLGGVLAGSTIYTIVLLLAH